MKNKLTHTKLHLTFYKTPIKIGVLFILIFLSSFRSSANVTTTKSTGGTSISADKAANGPTPIYTSLGNLILTEGLTTDFAIGTNLTFTITTPTGWVFNPAASVTATATASRDIANLSVLSKTSTVITIKFDVTGTTKSDVLTIGGIKVMASEGGNTGVTVTLTRGGTSVIAGSSSGANLGSLSEAVGVGRLVVVHSGQTFTNANTFAASGLTGSVTSQISRTAFSISKIVACDQFYNIITTYTGTKTITYSGPLTAVTSPSYTTSVSFTSGQSTTALLTTLKKSETTTITATDGTLSGVASSPIVVNPAVLNYFSVETNGGGLIPTQTAETPFNIQVSAKDQEANVLNMGSNIYSGTCTITSTGTLTNGGGLSAAFVAGVLSNKSVTISPGGTFSITATSGVITGVSNSFIVNNQLPTITSISPTCKLTGASTFTLTITGSGFNSNSVVQLNGASKTTTYVSSTGLTAIIPATDLTIEGNKNITVFNPTPGGGTNGNSILTVSTSPVISTQPISQMLCENANATFNVIASGFGITYQWKKNGVAIVNGGRISGATTSTLSISNIILSDTSSSYSVTISSTCFADVISSSVALNISPSTNAGILAGGTTVCSGVNSGTLTLSSYTGSIVQWESSVDNFASTGLVITNTTNTNNFLNLNQTTYYRTLVKSGVCNSGYSNVITVIVNPLPTAPASPTASNPQCMDSSITLTRQAPLSGTTWFWQSTNTGVSILDANLNKIVNSSGLYYLRARYDGTGCWSSSSASVNVTLRANTAGSQTRSICQGSSLILPDGVSVNSSGTYTSHLLNSYGCDSTVTTYLTVKNKSISSRSISICPGGSTVLPNGTVVYSAGTYISHLTNSVGCDSAITTTVTVISSTAVNQYVSICAGTTATLPDGVVVSTSGTYYSSAMGCDSMVTTYLTVIPNSSSSRNVSICSGSSTTLPDGAIASSAGTYVSHITNVAGCDSAITTTLTIKGNTISNRSVSICAGASLTLPNGQVVSSAGSYISHIANAVGCDSSITTILSVLPNSSSSRNISICNGATTTLPGGTIVSTAGTYVNHIPNAAGCDSTITTNLTVIPNSSSTRNISICNGTAYVLPDGDSATISGTYISHISNAAGCDSTITTTVTVNLISSVTVNVTICNSTSFTLPNGIVVSSAGIYISTIPSYQGCDSIVTTILSVVNSSSSSQSVSICSGDSYTLPNGNLVSVPGTYTTTIANSVGCDSVITTILVVKNVSSSTSFITICSGNNFTLPDGTIVTATGTYTTIIPNSAGCDSVITTHLTTITNTASSISVSICAGSELVLPDGNIVYPVANGIYSSTLVNANYLGCDSIITTNVTVKSLPTLTSVATQIRCFGGTGSVILSSSGGIAPYTLSSNPTTGLTAGLYYFTTTDANGCIDTSEVTINLAPSQLSLSATPNQIQCNGGKGSVTLQGVGGTSPYSYSGALTTNLNMGTYNYSVTDSKGCTALSSATILVAPLRITASIISSPTSCIANTGSSVVNPIGGTAPYTYSWNTSPIQLTKTAISLAAGPYIVTISDSHNCTSTASAIIVNSSAPKALTTGKTALCLGAPTTVCATPGMTSYLWSNGDTTQCSVISTVGTYFVRVTNLAGCSATTTVNITQSTLPICAISGADYICPGGSTALAAPAGYTYLWTPSSTKQIVNARVGGLYTVVIKNSAGCTSTCSKVISSPMKVSIANTRGSCANGFQGSCTAVVTGGVPPYSFSWSRGDTTSTINKLLAGPYSVHVTDSKGCVVIVSTVVTVSKASTDYSRIVTGFNNNDIPINRYIWFSAVVKVNYTGTYPLELKFTDQNIASSRFNINPKNARLIIDSSITVATTIYNGTEWVTTTPPSPSGNYFISGYSHKVPATILRNLSSITWKGIWIADKAGVTSLDWKWAAAVYSNFNIDCSVLGVKPVDGLSGSIYPNLDLAGSPENFKLFVVAGARGLANGDFVGTYTGIATRTPCTLPANYLTSPRQSFSSTEVVSDNFVANAFPNPFSSRTTIEFMQNDFDGHATVEVFNLEGQIIAKLYQGTIHSGERYSFEFNGADLPGGIYVYRISFADKVYNGRLVLTN